MPRPGVVFLAGKRERGAKSLLLLALCLLLTSCRGFPPPESEMPRGGVDETWTVCLYLCGSNLESKQGWASKTLEELTGERLPDNVTVVIQTGGSKGWQNDTVTAEKNGRYVIENGTLTLVDSAPAISMGDGDTLAGFLTFCAEQYPADRTAVVLWNHGGGPLKGACFDEMSNFDALTLPELDTAFGAGVAARGGKKFDLVGFDACLMGSLETAATLSDDADYLVASEEIEPGAGWDYTALLATMGRSAVAVDVAKAVCDGYMEKCESRNKGASATLAVIDLGKVQAVSEALDGALVSLRENRGADLHALRRMAFCSRSAESFGGATDSEGLSNLVDLRGMAESLAARPDLNGEGWQALVDAIDDAVVYAVNGSATRGANGLSLWYPRSFRANELKSYASDAALPEYAGTLSELFSASLGKITYSDPGSISEDGLFTVTIDPKSQDAFYDLYVVNRQVDGDYEDTNVDMEDDWENLTFGRDPGWAMAITLNGVALDAQTIAYDFDHILFSCPVTLNGEESNLRIAWMWEDTTGQEGHYELLGAWNGVDHVSGLSDRLEDTLSPGDVVGARSLTTGEVRETVTLDGEPVIDEAPMEPGIYECWFVAMDLHGKEYPSDVLTYQVTEEGKIEIIAITNHT